MRDSKTNFEDLIAVGQRKRRNGDLSGALLAFQAAHEVRPSHLGAQLELVEVLQQLGQLTEAGIVATRAVAEHPQHASSHIALGLVKRKAHDRPAALLAFARAAAIDAEHAFAHLELANELRAAGAHLEADVIIEKASLRCPNNPDVRVALGLARRRRNETEAALAAFRSAMSLNLITSART